MRRRIWWLFTLFVLCIGALALRVAAVAVGPSLSTAPRWQEALPARAEVEHYRLWRVDDGRGRILYRSGAPWSAVAQPAEIQVGSRHVPVLLRDATRDPLDPVVGAVGRPDVWPDARRAVAEQGRSGLERAFDAWVSARRAGYVGVVLDALGRPVSGEPAVFISPARGDDLVTTVDMAWQRAAVAAVRQPGIVRSALVVLDVRNGDVIALAGRDAREPGRIPAVRAEVPGSVFKLVTAMAALDSYRYRPDSRFWCDGRAQLPGVRMRCWAVHGSETLLEALAASCDAVFAELGAHVGRHAIADTAQRLGLTSTGLALAGVIQPLPESDAGIVFRQSGQDIGLVANTAIGQQDVRLTPLQGARLAMAIATGGTVRDARLVQRMEREGQVQVRFAPARPKRVCSSLVAAALARAMRMAVVSPHGTAHALADVRPALAVKTGTAELPDGRVNAWIVGFLPYDHPRFAFCAFAGDADEAVAHAAVQAMARDVAATYCTFYAAQGSGECGFR